MLAIERKCSGSAGNLLEFLVEKVVRLTMTRACREHGLRVTSRLLLCGKDAKLQNYGDDHEGIT